MRYAIGEIVLVVIGILIALQINNFNNDRQQGKIEQKYLLSLQTEFKTNLKKISECMAENKERISATEDILALFDNSVLDTISNEAVSDIIYSILGGEAIYLPSLGVLTDIISSGNLNVIQNEKLRQQLASFESTLDYIKLQENATHSVKGELQNMFNINGSVRKVMIDRGFNFEHKSISDMVDNKRNFSLIEFENNLLDYYLTISASNGPNFFGGIKEQIELILVEIDSGIKN